MGLSGHCGPARAEGEVTLQGSHPPRCYLETTIVSAIAREQFPDELPAMLRLLRWDEQGIASLVTSEITHQEIQKIPERHRGKHEELYNRLLKVSAVVTLTRLSSMGTPMVSRDVFTIRDLERLLPDLPDARHVYAAWRSGLDYFVTMDCHTILQYRHELKRDFQVTAVRPSELVRCLNPS